MELQGVAFFTEEDTTEAQAECFVEEFLRMGFDHHRILNLFKDTHYIGMNMILKNRGEAFVLHLIERVFNQWGYRVTWPAADKNSSSMKSNPKDGNTGEVYEQGL